MATGSQHAGELEIEVNRIATGIVRRATQRPSIKCKLLMTVLWLINRFALFIISAGYTIAYFLVIYLTKYRKECKYGTSVLGVLVFTMMFAYLPLYGLRVQMSKSTHITRWVVATLILTIAYFWGLVALWIVVQIYVFGIDLECAEKWFAFWLLLLVWTSVLYIVFISGVLLCVLGWKINREQLFSAFFFKNISREMSVPAQNPNIRV